jgi:ATP-binding protein involved in chromosome partitioning
MDNAVVALRTALARVIDPDLGRDLVTLDMVRDLAIDDGTARFRLVLTTPACPLRAELERQCRAAALSVPGITAVEIAVSAETPAGRAGHTPLPGVRHIIAVASGKGGVGKSTVAVNLACALAATGLRVGLLDADIHGPSIPTMLGITDRGLSSDGKAIIPATAHGLRVVSLGLMIGRDDAVIWRGPMLLNALRQFLADTAWGELDHLVVDLPPGTGDVPLTLAQTVPVAGAVIVTTPQDVALADVRRGIAMFAKLEVPVFGVVENMRGFICPACGHREDVFGNGGGERCAAEFGVPFLGAVPLEPAICATGDAGTPVVLAHPESASAQAFRVIAGRIAQQASIAAWADLPRKLPPP